MHESSPEYPVNNAIVAHERALEMAVMASLDLSAMGGWKSVLSLHP